MSQRKEYACSQMHSPDPSPRNSPRDGDGDDSDGEDMVTAAPEAKPSTSREHADDAWEVSLSTFNSRMAASAVLTSYDSPCRRVTL